MNALIPINYQNDSPTVLGRDLHTMLEVGTVYPNWFKRMCEYGFDEGKDFIPLLAESTGGRPAEDHQITLAMAKELCMLQRSEKGKQARQYFIAIEEQWNKPEAVMARALQMADRKIKSLSERIEQDKPKVLFADAVAASHSTILIGELAKLIRQNGYEIGQNRLFQWLRDNGYLIKRLGADYNMPTQRSMELELFTIKETAITKPDGSVTVTKTVKVTGKGQLYFINRLARIAQ